ncbi:hydrolase, NUDIX family [Ancylostoma caninum]|uniref:Hydrolase, NUDIX family n=1 Tax=Ancylostoma caninum TaxID=29170 RepID=A0A368GH75_ANCCA|nr:hydrolase, NUDIX family [Ancylostoma caninum]
MVLLVSGGKEGGKWVIPGGGVEQNECAEEAARRELEEEAGVKARAVEVIGLFQDDDRKHRTAVFLMEVEEELSVWEEVRTITFLVYLSSFQWVNMAGGEFGCR